MMKSMIKKNNYAYIDGQNLYMGTKSNIPSWVINLRRFRDFLYAKYHIQKAFYYLGFVDENQQNLYEHIQSTGFILVFRDHSALMLGKKKGNVDTDIVFDIMRRLYMQEDFDKIVLVSGDGDYIKLVDFLISQDRLEKVLLPNRTFASSLYKKIGNRYFADLSQKDTMEKIKQKEKGALGS